MAVRRKRVGAWAVAFPALVLAAFSAWLAFGGPSGTAEPPGRGDRAGGTRDVRAPVPRVADVPGPAPGPGAPDGGSPGAPGSGRDPGAGLVGDARSGPVQAGQAEPSGTGQPADEEREDRERLATGMAKLMSDLEWSPGLKEPPQQLVVPQPDPWRRDPSREGPPPAIESIVPRRARAGGGDRISIRGRNLRVVQVMFGAAPARVIAARGNEVIVETPPGTIGPVTVAVTNDDGTWAIAAEPFEYGD